MTAHGPAAVIVLAAGEGTRMRTATPKMLNEVCGRPMLGHVLAAARELKPERLILVVSDLHGQVAGYARNHWPEVALVVQERHGSWGTGHAVRTVVESAGVIHGTVIVLFSDTPMLRGQTLVSLATEHEAAGAAVTVLTSQAPDPKGYGRILRNDDGRVTGIVEEADATPEQRALTEISSGMFAFDGDLLADAVKRVPPASATGEEYLTEVPAILRADGHLVGSAFCPDFDEVQGVNNQVQLASARRVLNERLLARWMAAGVTIVDPASTWIDVDVLIEPGARISQATQLEGRTVVGAGARVGPSCLLRDTTVGAGATVVQAVCEDVVIEPGAVVGPFAHLTPGAGDQQGAKRDSPEQSPAAAELKHVATQGELTSVTGMTATPERKMMLFSGRGYPELGQEIAGCLGIEPTPTTAYDFANGEIFVRFLESVRGSDAFVLQSHTSPINQWIMEQLIMVDALKRASAKRITVVTPFFGYARQDKKSRGREPISARLMADLFQTAGADRLMAVDLHTAQIQGFFDGPVDHLFALPILASYLEDKLDVSQVTVVAPDAGRVRVCERWTDRLGCPLAIIHKRRDPDVANQAKVLEVVGQVAGRTCIVVDDMIDTGQTIVKAADTLFDQGAAQVIVTATHGVLSGNAVDMLKNSRVSEVIVTNTLPILTEKRFDKLTVLSIAPLIARAINEVFSDGSVTSLFDGQS